MESKKSDRNKDAFNDFVGKKNPRALAYLSLFTHPESAIEFHNPVRVSPVKYFCLKATKLIRLELPVYRVCFVYTIYEYNFSDHL